MSDKIWQFENEWYIKPDGHVFAICMNSEEAAKMLLDHEEAVEQSVHPTQLRCICTQLTALEPVVNPDCPVHGSLRG